MKLTDDRPVTSLTRWDRFARLRKFVNEPVFFIVGYPATRDVGSATLSAPPMRS